MSEKRSESSVVVAHQEAAAAPLCGRAGLESLTPEMLETISCLAQAAEELNSTLELDEVLENLAGRVKQFVEYDTFGVHLLDPLGEELRIRFGIGYPLEVIKHWRLGLGQGIVGTAAKTRQPVLVGDVSGDTRYINAREGIRSELAVPLIICNRTVGVLDIGSRKINAFSKTTERLLTFLAGHLANAVENARLYENLRDQARMLSLLHEVTRELTAILDRQELFGRVARRIKRLVDYQVFCLMLWNEATERLEHAFSLRYDERISLMCDFPLGHGIVGTAAALRQPVRVPNVHLDPRYVRCKSDVEVHSELAVPMVVKDRLIGVIDLESTEYNAFSERHEQMVSTLASYVAIALENARLYEQLRADEQRLEADLATARDIQERLLPEAPPRIRGLDIAVSSSPARELGGDVYDFLPYSDGRLGIAVGDVAGKATAAALYGTLAIGMLRGHLVQHPCEPAEMLELMNRYLQQLRVDGRYVAMAYALYNPAGRTLLVANAGFPRPHLVRQQRTIEEIPVAGVPLGLLPDTVYEEQQLTLEPGDVILLCSDGLHECMNKHQEEFGLGRLRELLARLARGTAREIADGILRATDEHAAGNGGMSDDRTVVVLKVTGE